MNDEFDRELLQARWVLGGINPEQMPDYAVKALQLGYDGTRLRQLAGLNKPTRPDLEDLPERAFAEMGLPPMDKEQAVDLVIARGIPAENRIMKTLIESFPAFSHRWRKHVAWWGGGPAGDYINMSEFVHFVVEDLYEGGQREEVARAFRLLEDLVPTTDEEELNIIALGFFETLQNFASWRPYGNRVFEEFMGPESAAIGRRLGRIWAGKSSLMDVLRDERDQ